MKACIYVKLRSSVLDPQGKAVHMGLETLGFTNVKDVRVGRFIEMQMDDGTDKDKAHAMVKDMCEKFLVNMVIEDYSFTIEG
ncbi:MAG: phosphoribosylformylglycinamidine synthase subunit PurS [Candidatus Magnetoovum sp. WYHC-5]|nr:phosphoribosylformylglycinamidine synthase subunit PurS [Candidatus Magnetoovum sp. WYHC-5]